MISILILPLAFYDYMRQNILTKYQYQNILNKIHQVVGMEGHIIWFIMVHYQIVMC